MRDDGSDYETLLRVLEVDGVKLVNSFDFIRNGTVFVFLRQVDRVREFDSLEATIRRDCGNAQVIDLAEFGCLGHGGARHSGDLLVKLEEVLQRDGRQGLSFFLDANIFFCFDRLVKSIAPLATFHQAACEFIDDNDFAVFDDVIHIAFVQLVCFQSVV